MNGRDELVEQKGSWTPRIAIRDRSLRQTLDLTLVIARNLGFQGVELSLGGRQLREHPIWSRQGIGRLSADRDAARMHFPSVRMEASRVRNLFSSDPAIRQLARKLLLALVPRAAALHVDAITLPLVSRLEPDSKVWAEAVAYLRDFAAVAGAYQRQVVLSASWSPERLHRLLEEMDSPHLGAELDVALVVRHGYSLRQAALDYGALLTRIRLRDVAADGTICPLGSGAVDFMPLFEALYHLEFDGYYIVDVPPGTDSVATAAANLAYVRECTLLV